MAIVVGTNSYVTEAELTTYCSERGIALTATAEILLIKAMDYLESRTWQGVKTSATQALEWPRIIGGCYDTFTCSQIYIADARESYYVDPLVVPNDIKKAQMVAAVLTDGGAALQPTIARTVKREIVEGAVEIEYMDNAMPITSYTQLTDLIRPYLKTQASVTRV